MTTRCLACGMPLTYERSFTDTDTPLLCEYLCTHHLDMFIVNKATLRETHECLIFSEVRHVSYELAIKVLEEWVDKLSLSDRNPRSYR